MTFSSLAGTRSTKKLLSYVKLHHTWSSHVTCELERTAMKAEENLPDGFQLNSLFKNAEKREGFMWFVKFTGYAAIKATHVCFMEVLDATFTWKLITKTKKLHEILTHPQE